MVEPVESGRTPAVSEQKADTFSVSGREALGTLAIALSWVWFVITMFSDSFLLPLPPTLHIEPLFREAAFIAIALTFVVILWIGTRIHSKRGFAATLIAAAVLSPWIPTCNTLAGTYPPMLLEVIIWVAFGIAAALLLCAESLFLRTLNQRNTALVLGIAVTVGACLYFILIYTTPTVRMVAVDCLGLLSALCFWFTGVGRRLDTEREALPAPAMLQSLRTSLRIQPAQPAYGVVLSLVLSIAISISVIGTGQFPMSVAIGLCLAGPVAFAMALLPQRFDTGVVQWYLLPLSVIGLMFTVLDSPSAITLCGAVLALCYSFFELLHTLSLAELMREADESSLFAFAAGKVLFFIGVAVGWGLGELLLSVGYHSMAYRIIVLCTAAIIVLVMAVIGRPGKREAMDQAVIVPPAAVQARHDEVCIQIAREVGLSPRQIEVFLLLSKGRNAPYIEEELVVSYHTVKAHIYRIYQKLGVHTHQELIDLVEKRLNS